MKNFLRVSSARTRIQREKAKKKIKKIERLQSQIVLYEERNSDENLIEKISIKNLKTSLNIMIIVEIIFKIFEMQQLMIKFCRAIKIKAQNIII